MRPTTSYYHRTYETNSDSTHNSHLGDGRTGRARSGSIGTLEADGSRTNRHHYHAEVGRTTVVREMPDAVAHNGRELRDAIAYSSRPMLIPGAVTRGTETGTRRWDE